MKKKHVCAIIGLICLSGLILILALTGVNHFLTDLIEETNGVCKGQKFWSAEEAIQAMEREERKENDIELDYCPPYKLLYTFDCENNTIVFYSFCNDFDGTQSKIYAVRVLKHNDDGTLSFDTGFADFHLEEPSEDDYYYFFTNINTSKGKKTISLLYLPKDSNKDIYVDGKKAIKTLVEIDNQEFYICYAITKRDTFLSNILTPINKRHNVVVK